MYLTQIGYSLFASPLKWAVILAPLALVFFLSFRIQNMRPATAQTTFWIYAALVGVSLGVDLHGLHAHLDHAGVLHHGRLVRRALAVGLHHAARPVGLGLLPVHGPVRHHHRLAGEYRVARRAATMLQWIISVVGVLVFAGLTAYDTQRLKSEYIYGAMEGDVLERSAIMGALSLYLDFLNLFTMLLHLLGARDE